MTGDPCPSLDLSDVELRVRLSQRGVPTDEARHLVDHRETADAHDRIDELLEHHHG